MKLPPSPRMASGLAAALTPLRPPARSTLVLNADYTPLSVTSAWRALQLRINQRAQVLEESGAFLQSELLRLACPSVIVLNEYQKVGNGNGARKCKQHDDIACRSGVFERDAYKCQYCGAPATTWDHILPKSKGGRTVWNNVVACCQPCNARKSDRLLAETSMRLKRKPVAFQEPPQGVRMSRRLSHQVGNPNRNDHSQWSKYLQRV